MLTDEQLQAHFFIDDMIELREFKCTGTILVLEEMPFLLGWWNFLEPDENVNDNEIGVL
jgi:hypothetical protein